jgi:hypothetical protein
LLALRKQGGAFGYDELPGFPIQGKMIGWLDPLVPDSKLKAELFQPGSRFLHVF